MRLRALLLSLCLLVGSVGVVLPNRVAAAAAPYAALRVTTTGSGSLSLTPGEVKPVTITFQNTGTSTWKNDGTGYVSLYTHGPKYRTSVFDPGTWLSATQVKRLQEVSVAPGATGTISFSLRAPQTPGTYSETFALASEGTAWITGGQVSLSITVAEKAPSSASPVAYGSTNVSTPIASTLPEPTYTANIVAQTATKLKAKAGKPISFMIAVKNTGTATWDTVTLTDASSVAAAKTGQRVSFAHSSWSGKAAVIAKNQEIAPGETATLQFFMQAPQVNGNHSVAFTLTADGEELDGGELLLPVEVTGGSGELADTPATTGASFTTSPVFMPSVDEPTIRVGVLIVDEETDWEVEVGSKTSDVELRNTDGTLLLTIPKGGDLRAAYENGSYVYGSGSSEKTSTLPLRFVPITANAVLEVTNFDRRVTRGTSFANNTFRNVLELRYNASKNRTWLINELPMEYYLRGLAETSNSSPVEYQKAILTAARTYAYYHYTHTSKHAAEGYLVDAYRDQVYWGYGQEERNPAITAAVEASRGEIVTYQGATAITSYFSRSDGMTRNWSDVWAGNIPYAKAVSVPCDQGKTLWGHGVGMSASGAICMANEGKTSKEILTYFYTGVEVARMWE